MVSLLVILAVVVGGAAVSRHFPTEDLLQDQFALGQKYYAANDHGNAVRVFEQIERTPNYALLNVDGIIVTIGEVTLPLRQAATYQLGNSYRNVGRTQLERSEAAAAEGQMETSRLRTGEARGAFESAKEHYRRLIEDPAVDEDLRAMAQYQVIRAAFQMGDFSDVVDEVSFLRQRFPDSEHLEAAVYDQGWAEYHTGRHEDAIVTFAELLRISDDALKLDRALFQTAESQYALGRHGEARATYGRLVSKYDFGAMSEKQLKEMKTARLRGLVQETTRELVAKAQIRIGDAFGEEGRLDDAATAYSLVPERYPQETLLVQRSFENMATLMRQQRGVDAAISVLRRAIEQVEDPIFQGKAQFRIATMLYRQARYREALDDLLVYVRAYGDQAVTIGITLDRVEFLMGEAQRLRADLVADVDAAAAADSYGASIGHYRTVLADHPHSPRIPEARYGLALSHQAAGRPDSALANFLLTWQEHPAAAVAPFALNWEGRLRARQGHFDAAQQAYERLIERYPEAGPPVDLAWRDLGLVRKQAGDLEGAIAAFRRVSPSSDSWPKVQAEAGDILLAQGRVDRIDAEFDIPGAVEQVRRAGDRETAAELRYIKGRIARERDDSVAEIAELSAAIEGTDNPQLRTFCLFFRGLAAFRHGSAQDAQGDSAASADRFALCVADLEEVIEAGGSAEMRSVAYRTRGVALTKLGRASEAVENYRLLMEAVDSPEERSDFELMLMEFYYDLGQLDETAATARNIIGADFRDDDSAGFYKKERAFLVLTSVLLETEQYDETVRVARQALRRYPRCEEAPTLRLAEARALFAAESFAAAAAAFEEYLASHPDHADAASAYYQLGYAHELLGGYDEAADAFGALAERFPDDPLASESLYRGGENLYNASRFADALPVYRQVIDRYPGSESAEKAMYSAAWTLMDLERETESIQAMEQLAQTFPDGLYARLALFSIGDYSYNQKRFEQAREAYAKVARRYPGTPEADKAEGLIAELTEDMASRAYETAFAELDLGRYLAAVEGFDRVYEEYPETYSGLAALANKGVALEKLGDGGQARATYERVLRLSAADPEGTRPIAEFARLRLDNL